jgi:uncharacterized protein YjbJ (UPF0337 family)
MEKRRPLLLLLALAGLTVLPPLATPQSRANSGDFSSAGALPSPTTHPRLDAGFGPTADRLPVIRERRKPSCKPTNSKFITKGKDKMLKPSAKDQTKGKLHEVKGKIKEEAGKATNDLNLEVSGNAEKKAGKVQELIGHAEKAVGE